MKQCKHCGVSVAGNRASCPLCQSPLSGEWDGEAPDFPSLHRLSPMRALALRILAFLTIAAIVVCTAVNMMTPEHGYWIFYVLGGCASGWVLFLLFWKKMKSVLKNLIYQTGATALLCVLWDLATGWNLWSLNYALPIVFTLCMVLMLFLALIRRIPPADSLLYFGESILLAFVPLVLLLCGVITVPLPTIICASAALVFLAGLVMFYWNPFWAEIRRRFHI